MADTKISALPASTVPLAGTEVLPIVQSSTTKQVSVANLTAGRAIAASSITTDTYKAASSSGGTLQNLGGTPQLQWGAGGGNNLSVDVAININPANAAVAISPTGTGTVTINPATASTMNNVAIGGSIALAGKFTSITGTGLTSGRVTYATTSGLLTDNANLTFDGTTLTAATGANLVTSSGSVNINRTSAIGAGKANIDFSGAVGQGLAINDTASQNGSQFEAFYYGSGTFLGSISNVTNTAVAYNTTSDYRLKENIAPMTGALSTVAQLKPSTYKWKINGSDGQGFIAHELAEVMPDCVNGEKDAVDADGKPRYQGIDTSFLVATLTCAIQEQQALIESLTTRLTALENK